MKKSIVVFSFLMVSVSGLFAQRATVKMAQLNEPTIIYTAKELVLKFNKQSFLDVYTSMQNGVWVTRNPRENKAAIVAIDWLKSQKKPIQLDENLTDQSKPETALVWLVQNLVGAQLILKGDVEVYEKATKKKEVIEVLEEVSELSGKSYTFFNPGHSTGFLKFWNVNEWVGQDEEVQGEVEVVFEEPVKEIQVADESKVYLVVEQQPEYPGGMSAWTEYIQKSLKYPKDAVKQLIEGSVFVAFVVQETGKITDVSVIKGISPSCDKEAERLIKESKDWKPGKQRGKPVKVKFVWPVKFRLADLEKK
ncbi:MAG TPA: energy transducer TonB [Cyclobacteriaceae bacterium]|nr:energy transducer TonB [Cyclobacteriaceae bacterium]